MLSPTVALTAIRHGFTAEQIKEISDLNGLGVTKADITNVRKWSNTGCMAGFRRVVAIMEIAGFVVTIKPQPTR